MSRVRQEVPQNLPATKSVQTIRKIPFPSEQGPFCQKARQLNTQPSESARTIFSYPSHSHLEFNRPVLSLVGESLSVGPSTTRTATGTQQ